MVEKVNKIQSKKKVLGMMDQVWRWGSEVRKKMIKSGARLLEN